MLVYFSNTTANISGRWNMVKWNWWSYWLSLWVVMYIHVRLSFELQGVNLCHSQTRLGSLQCQKSNTINRGLHFRALCCKYGSFWSNTISIVHRLRFVQTHYLLQWWNWFICFVLFVCKEVICVESKQINVDSCYRFHDLFDLKFIFMCSFVVCVFSWN